MKLERLQANKPTQLSVFFERNLPASICIKKKGWLSKDYEAGIIRTTTRMTVRRVDCAYGSQLIYEQTPSKTFDKIAVISEDYVELFAPEYFSDFQSVIEKYERATNREVTFRYWES